MLSMLVGVGSDGGWPTTTELCAMVGRNKRRFYSSDNFLGCWLAACPIGINGIDTH